MRWLALWAWEQATYRAWGLSGYAAPSRLSALHYRAESRLRREEARRDGE